MHTYIFVSSILVFFGVFYARSSVRMDNIWRSLSTKIAVFSSFTVLFVVSAFRGPFTSDYNNYIWLFEFINRFDFKTIFSYRFQQEFGYVLLNRVIGIFTDDGLFLMILTSFLILLLFFTELVRESENVWLSILMFVTVGSYYTSFNITRQIIAVAIIFSASRYLYQRDIIKYFICIFTATLFHKTSLIMLLFFFLLNLKFSFRRALIFVFAFLVLFINANFIFELVTNFVYSYYTPGAYGTHGMGFRNAVASVAMLFFSLLHLRFVDMTQCKNRIMFNAVLFYALFSLLGTRVMMLQRFSEFFAPYSLLLIPKIVSMYKNPKERLLFYTMAVVILVSYNYAALSGTGYMNYYFIWESWS